MRADAALAPNPIDENQIKLAQEAPIAKNHLSLSNWLAMLPTKITVSRYTWGFKYVRAETVASVRFQLRSAAPDASSAFSLKADRRLLIPNQVR